MSDLTTLHDRLALPCITPRCQPCCGLESAPGWFTKRLCGECPGNQMENLLFRLRNDLCSGQWTRFNSPSPTYFTVRLLFVVNKVYILGRCCNSCVWPPKVCTIKGGYCAQWLRGGGGGKGAWDHHKRMSGSCHESEHIYHIQYSRFSSLPAFLFLWSRGCAHTTLCLWPPATICCLFSHIRWEHRFWCLCWPM